MHNTPCIIFAGGKSSRMGEDKALLPFAAFSTLAEYQHSRLSKLFKNVYISTKEPSKFNFSANFIVDKECDEVLYAPTSGFIAAFETLKAEKIFIISIDAPFVTQEEIEQLFNSDESAFDATIAKTSRGIEPMCGIYHGSLLKSFVKMQKNGSHRLSLLLQNAKTNYVEFSNDDAFLNLNYPQDYKEALLLLDS